LSLPIDLLDNGAVNASEGGAAVWPGSYLRTAGKIKPWFDDREEGVEDRAFAPALHIARAFRRSLHPPKAAKFPCRSDVIGAIETLRVKRACAGLAMACRFGPVIKGGLQDHCVCHPPRGLNGR